MPSIVSVPLVWAALLAVLTMCLGADLWAHRRPSDTSLGDAARWTAAWVGLAATCAAAIWLVFGGEAFLQYVASYAVEWSLSLDNVAVFALVLAGLAVPAAYRYRVLLYGSLGAIAMRQLAILAGWALLDRFGWLTYVFGAMLLLAAARFALEPDGGEADGPGASGFLRRWLPVTGSYDGGRLTAVVAGRRLATPLLLALLAIALTDVLFAADSIPAVFAMTRDPLVACVSNAAAVLGLRPLYFVLEGAMRRLRYLQPALVVLLALVSAKMLAEPLFDVPVLPSLAGIVAILGAAVLASLVAPRISPARG